MDGGEEEEEEEEDSEIYEIVEVVRSFVRSFALYWFFLRKRVQRPRVAELSWTKD